MTNLSREDLESAKFGQNHFGDIVVGLEETTEDSLAVVDSKIEDLEYNKFTEEGKIRTVFTS